MDIHTYLQMDCREHKARSAAELLEHADPSSSKTMEERKDYFYGITAVFPMMLLGHYYDWLSGQQGKPYMEEFVPVNEKKCGAPIQTLMQELFFEPVGDSQRLAALGGGMAASLYRTLGEFSAWAFSDEQAIQTHEFIAQDMVSTLPDLCSRMAGASQEELLQTVLWLGTEFPFELLERFHKELFGT